MTVAGRMLVGGAAGAALAHMLPSVLVLGQWAPVRATPNQACMWRIPAGPHVALTFDDGPEPGTTAAVLDRLDVLGLRATFFCLGERVLRHPGLTREIAARGHEVATHGHQHRSHFRASSRWIGDDMRRSIDALTAEGLPRPRWFRPPFGHVTAGTVLHARRNGLPLVLWSAMGKEWDEPTGHDVAHRISRRLSPGAIVLLHDSEITTGSSGRVLDALPAIAAEVSRRGWATVALDAAGPRP